MSDDDCDIFNMPVHRINAVPQKQFVPDPDLNEADYDFIKTSHAVKKTAKVAKAKQTTQKKSKDRKTQKDGKEVINLIEKEAISVATVQAPPTRDLSPVSQLIYEMEQRQTEAKAKEIEKLPIARRTRSAAETVVNPGSNRQKTDSAVIRRIEAFIDLDSDEDNELLAVAQARETALRNFEDENRVIEINLNWLGEIQTYKLRQHQKFSHMFKEVAKRNGLPREDIVINKDEHLIDPNESPQSVGLKVFHILSGGALKSNKTVAAPKRNENLMLKPKKFQLKIQGDKWKQPLIIPMKKTDTFKILYIKCAEEMECDVNELKLFFDGEVLDPDDTPQSQDMEGNEMIDLRSK